MLEYKQMREVLRASPERLKLKYFTKAFYHTFCEAWKTKDWEPVHTTEFYTLEGFSYCVFLELFAASLPRWRLTFVKMDHGYPINIGQRYINEDTEAAAKSVGLGMLERFDADYVDVIKAA